MSGAQPSSGLVWRAFGGLAALTVAGQLAALAAPGLAPALRAWFDFPPDGRAEGADQALAAWIANLRVVGFVSLASLAAGERWLRPAADVLVAVMMAANVALVGLALGAYGAPLLPWLAHIPLEWTALAIVLAAYLRARRCGPRPLVLAKGGAAAAALLALAAAVETWATPLALP